MTDTQLSKQPTRLERHKKAWSQGLLFFFNNDGFSAAGNMAFLTMLSLFPFVIFLITIAGFLGQGEQGEEAIRFTLTLLPPEVSSVIRGPINGIVANAGGDILAGSIFIALWTASAGVEAARGILLKAFGWEHAEVIWLRRVESLAVVIIGSLLVITAMSVLVLGPATTKAVTSLVPPEAAEPFALFIDRLRILISPAVLLFGIYGVYLALTPRRVVSARRMPGTIVALLVFIVSAKGLSLYLAQVNTYDLTYGSLAGVVIMQIFCYLVALGYTLGAELNAAYTQVFVGDPSRIEFEADAD